MTAVLCDGEFYCTDCAEGIIDPTRECVEDGGGEGDVPTNCAGCGVFLENPLTQDGVKYVLEKCEEWLTRPESERDRIRPAEGTAEETQTHYKGSKAVQVVLDWATDLKGYSLDRVQRRILTRFFTYCDPELETDFCKDCGETLVTDEEDVCADCAAPAGPVVVCFRRDLSDGTIVAVFSQQAEGDARCAIFEHFSQHGIATHGYVRHQTIAATALEYASLLRELTAPPYSYVFDVQKEFKP